MSKIRCYQLCGLLFVFSKCSIEVLVFFMLLKRLSLLFWVQHKVRCGLTLRVILLSWNWVFLWLPGVFFFCGSVEITSFFPISMMDEIIVLIETVKNLYIFFYQHIHFQNISVPPFYVHGALFNLLVSHLILFFIVQFFWGIHSSFLVRFVPIFVCLLYTYIGNFNDIVFLISFSEFH